MTELSVRSESVQRLYFLYLADRFDVNRRYQRKLVWSAAEKQRLVDSILRDLPIPLILVAEIGLGADNSFEVIDGLQRLNAIFSFIENEIPGVNGEFFDLDALADTKSRKDEGTLTQRMPVMSRERSVRFCNYSIALSVFRAHSSNSVDEVFRRINSGGRRLSRQELRQAGTISPLANLVRIISSRIRSDTSPGDSVPLRLMPQLSITNYDLDYGVDVKDIFWVRHGILRREDVRTSLDEQVILDVLVDCLVDPTPNTSSDARDEYYNFSENVEGEDDSARSCQITAAITAYGRDDLERDVMRSYDVLRGVLDDRDARFATLVGVRRGGYSPRYFHAIFMAIFELMFKERMRVKDAQMIADKLSGITRGQGPLSIPGGSDWTGDAKRASFDAVKGVLRPAFEDAGHSEDFGRYGWAWQVETIMGNALVEQQMFDCKQGLLRLDQSREFDSSCLGKITKTMSAMANMGRDSVGYIMLGIADKQEDANRIASIDGISVQHFKKRFAIVGIEREAVVRGEDMNIYWTWLMQKLREAKTLDRRLAAQVVADARLANYAGHLVGILKVRSIGEPAFYGQDLYERSGSETRKLSTPDYTRVFSRFLGAN
ncbi:DUF262 domain-containing protein [Mangrovihabitans endophyticus]|uniref:DUF262 domain-containing protein n=1 Tax=Mangrovihabitans endophyticus TaxID=1751298 RepID=UPI00166DA9F4|nr:DUF262 domain-containing protein [Mangrovihabitans endophyticus]